jgi:hypothetical protein
MDALSRRPCLEACAHCSESWTPGILKVCVIIAAAMDGWGHAAQGDSSSMVVMWGWFYRNLRLETIPSGRTSETAVQSATVTGLCRTRWWWEMMNWSTTGSQLHSAQGCNFKLWILQQALQSKLGLGKPVYTTLVRAQKCIKSPFGNWCSRAATHPSPH